MAKLDPRLVPVEPIGSYTANCFYDGPSGSGFGPREFPRYPDHPEADALARRRKDLGLGLGKASDRLGMSAENLSGLEHGRYTPKDAAGWLDLEALLLQPSAREEADRG